MDAEMVAADAGRGADGRFRPGFSGNPAGKKKGTRHRRTVLAELMSEEQRLKSGGLVVESATSDLATAKFLFPWHTPKPRGRLVELDLPQGGSPEEIDAAFAVVMAALGAGEITLDEALGYARLFALRAAAFDRLRAAQGEGAPADPAAAFEAALERELAARRAAPPAPAGPHTAGPHSAAIAPEPAASQAAPAAAPALGYEIRHATASPAAPLTAAAPVAAPVAAPPTAPITAQGAPASLHSPSIAQAPPPPPAAAPAAPIRDLLPPQPPRTGPGSPTYVPPRRRPPRPYRPPGITWMAM